MRPNIVDKYVRDILNKDDPRGYQSRMQIVRRMFELQMDNRVLNQMRQSMNEQIEDERGLMKVDDFKKMFFTAYGRVSMKNKTIVYNMLLPTIMADMDQLEPRKSKLFKEKRPTPMANISSFVSIGKLSRFIDFFNYVPVKVNEWHHKNESSEDLALYMGKTTTSSANYAEHYSDAELAEIKKEGNEFKRLLALVSGKIYERFKDIVQAFRYFDTDHQLSLTLNEFAQGIEYLRIKMSFEDVKRLFMYLDVNFNKEINLNEFKLLSEENWRKIDPVARYI